MEEVTKLSISMPHALVAQVKDAAARDGVAVSAWLASAAEHELALRAARTALRDYEAEHGEITAAELAASDARVTVVGSPRQP